MLSPFGYQAFPNWVFKKPARHLGFPKRQIDFLKSKDEVLFWYQKHIFLSSPYPFFGTLTNKHKK